MTHLLNYTGIIITIVGIMTNYTFTSWLNTFVNYINNTLITAIILHLLTLNYRKGMYLSGLAEFDEDLLGTWVHLNQSPIRC